MYYKISNCPEIYSSITRRISEGRHHHYQTRLEPICYVIGDSTIWANLEPMLVRTTAPATIIVIGAFFSVFRW